MHFEEGVHLVTGIKANMKNKLIPMRDEVMLRKRCIIETTNDMLMNTSQLIHYRHRSVNNFIMSMIATQASYCFFDNKPHTLQGYSIKIPNNSCYLEFLIPNWRDIYKLDKEFYIIFDD